MCFRYDPSEQTITFSKLVTEAQEQGVKTVQNQERRHKSDVNNIVLVFLLLTVTCWLTFKMTYFTFFFLQILLAGRLTVFYLNNDTIAFKVAATGI